MIEVDRKVSYQFNLEINSGYENTISNNTIYEMYPTDSL